MLMASALHKGSALERHVLGRGRFTADLDAPEALVAAFVRSPHAHARIAAVRTAAADAMPGVVAVLMAGEVAAAEFGPMPTAPMRGADGRPIVTPRWPVLAEDRVCHVGQPVALVIAESEWAALDAAEAVDVAYEALPAVTASGDAMAGTAPALWPGAPQNVLLRWTAGDTEAVAAAIARAARVVRVEVVAQRVVPAPLETRSALALYDPTTGRIDLETPSQGAAFLRRQLLAVTGWEGSRLNVRTADVGGAFGMKTSPYPEQAAILLAADRLRRSVRWVASRSEAFVSDAQGRDAELSGDLALDVDGRFLALLARSRVNLGAFLTTHGAFTACHNFAACIAGCYATPAIAVEVTGIATNCVPVGPYRGAGRPEANLLLEALVDAAARASGIDAVELRRRNLVRPEAMPYATPLGQVYDSGDFGRVLDRAEVAADRAGFPARRRDSRRRGFLRGLGMGLYLEAAGGLPDESARVRVDADGRVRAFAPGQSSGQSHDATFRQVLSGRLGVSPDRIDIVQGDIASLPGAGPSVASRSLVAGGTMLVKAADALVEQGRGAAAELLQAHPDEVTSPTAAIAFAGPAAPCRWSRRRRMPARTIRPGSTPRRARRLRPPIPTAATRPRSRSTRKRAW
jgi:aerobic carbon-monoxide dehydrogenase large subunit